MAAVLMFQRRLRAVICDGCGCSYLTRQINPWLCERCDELFEAQCWEQWDEEARARGFASAEAQYEAWLRGDETAA